MNDFNKIEEKLNKIDLGNDNKYDLLNLYESVELSITEEVTLSEMLESNEEAKKIHDFLCGTLNEDFDEDETDASDKKVKVHYYASNIDAIAEETFDYDYFVENKDKILNSYDDVVDVQVFDGDGTYVRDIDESLYEAQERQAKIEIRKEYSWYNVYINNTMILKHISKEDADDIIDVLEKNNHPYIYKETESSRWADERRKAKETVEESMSSAVERQTLGYKKTKGQIQCNGGEQAKEVEDLLKAKYDNVIIQKGKGGKVIIKFSKNESLGEGFSKDDIEWLKSHKGEKLNKGKYKVDYQEYFDNDNNPIGGEFTLYKRAGKYGYDRYAFKNEDELVAYIKRHFFDESLSEDTVKQGSQWVNKGKEGTHGKFKTKKEADAQRKAMFARGFKEGIKESIEDVWDNASLPGDSADYKGHEIKVTPYGYQVTFDNGEEIEFADDREAMEYIDSLNEGIEDTNKKIDPKTLPDDYVLLNSNVTNYTDEDIDLYYDCIREFCNIDEIDYDDLEVTFITNQRDADDWDEETYTSSWKYRPDDYKAEEYANDYLAKKYPNIITVGDIKKSADDVYEYIKSMFWEEAQEEAQDKLSPADFELY